MESTVKLSKDLSKRALLQQQLDKEIAVIDDFLDGEDRKTIVVQGLGFVGTAMVAAVASARDDKGKLIYNVIGVDLPGEKNRWKIDKVNNSDVPILSSDKSLNSVFQENIINRNIIATSSDYVYSKADVVIVDINLDVQKGKIGKPENYCLSYEAYKKSLMTIAYTIRPDTLIILETTIPPGTTERVVYPLFTKVFKERGLDVNKLNLAFSYERVMPGPNYLNSITNYYKVYSGINSRSKKLALEFFETFINTKDYPIFELETPRAAEMAKLLENSYRAVNIAFIQEWTKYAHRAGVNLFEVIEAVRSRSTHNNIMYPGFGVGGYCLPKDALLADWSCNNLFNCDHSLEMSLRAIAINDLMPEFAFSLLEEKCQDLNNIHITILGVSYRSDVADTRNSPTGLFYDKCLEHGAKVILYDEQADFWEEKGLKIETDLNVLRTYRHDVVVFAVRHRSCLELTSEDVLSLFKGVKIVLDANNIINDKTARELSDKGIRVIGVGKGHWNSWGRDNG